MLARLRAGQPDGRPRQEDDDFGGWVNNNDPILAVCRQNFNSGTMQGTLHSFQRRLPIVSEIFALKVAIKLRSRRK